MSGPPSVEEICNLDLIVLGWIKEKPELFNRLKIDAMYDYSVKRQEKEVLEIRRDEQMRIPKNIDYLSKSLSLSVEEREKLMIIQPQTIAAATRIQGTLILIYVFSFKFLFPTFIFRYHTINYRSSFKICEKSYNFMRI